MTDARSLPRSQTQALESASTSVAFHVVWHVPPHLDLIQTSGILSGLSVLAGRGRISLTVGRTDDVMDSAAVMQLTMTQHASSTVRRLVIDLHDREDLVFPAAMQWGDQYLKRQWTDPLP